MCCCPCRTDPPTAGMSHQAVHESEITKNAVVKGQVLIVCTNASKLKHIETGLWWVPPACPPAAAAAVAVTFYVPQSVTNEKWRLTPGFGVMEELAY